MRVSDFVGACWRRVWVKGPSLPDEPSFPPGLKSWGMVCCALPAASGTALHSTSGRLGYQQHWLHQRQLLTILKKKGHCL